MVGQRKLRTEGMGVFRKGRGNYAQKVWRSIDGRAEETTHRRYGGL